MNGCTGQNGEGQRSRRRDIPPMVVLGFHLLGVVATAAAIMWFLLPSAHMGVIWENSWASTEVGRNVVTSIGFHLVVSTVVWFSLMTVLQKGRAMLRRSTPVNRATTAARGSVYVETLVVFPVLLMLTFGLIQLTFINLGGALAHVAAYEGARTVWLWQPEVSQHGPASRGTDFSVTNEDVEERARIAAALVMTPVAPGDYGAIAPDTSDEFEAIRDGMVARFTPTPQLTGVANQVTQLGGGQARASLVKSLDSASMPNRAYRKFTVAYLGTEIEDVIIEGDRTGVHFAHYQRMAMPFVHWLFGSDRHPSGVQPGSYFRWDIEYTMPPQRHAPNRNTP